MAELVISRGEMVKILNNHFTAIVENISCGGEFSFKPEDRFQIFTNFKDGKNLSCKWATLMECYHLHETETEPSWLVKAESDYPEFLVMANKKILGL